MPLDLDYIEHADFGPEEPELYKLSGFDDCERCYFRLSTIERITLDTRKMQRQLINTENQKDEEWV